MPRSSRYRLAVMRSPSRLYSVAFSQSASSLRWRSSFFRMRVSVCVSRRRISAARWCRRASRSRLSNQTSSRRHASSKGRISQDVYCVSGRKAYSTGFPPSSTRQGA